MKKAPKFYVMKLLNMYLALDGDGVHFVLSQKKAFKLPTKFEAQVAAAATNVVLRLKDIRPIAVT